MDVKELPNKSVVVFQRTHNGGSKLYTYAAINSTNGWHLTGRPGAMSSDELTTFIQEGTVLGVTGPH